MGRVWQVPPSALYPLPSLPYVVCNASDASLVFHGPCGWHSLVGRETPPPTGRISCGLLFSTGTERGHCAFKSARSQVVTPGGWEGAAVGERRSRPCARSGETGAGQGRAGPRSRSEIRKSRARRRGIWDPLFLLPRKKQHGVSPERSGSFSGQGWRLFSSSSSSSSSQRSGALKKKKKTKTTTERSQASSRDVKASSGARKRLANLRSSSSPARQPEPSGGERSFTPETALRCSSRHFALRENGARRTFQRGSEADPGELAESGQQPPGARRRPVHQVGQDRSPDRRAQVRALEREREGGGDCGRRYPRGLTSR
ncbi:Serine/arginine repetitive matrix protein 2, partial [Ophiophagus hannah]